MSSTPRTATRGGNKPKPDKHHKSDNRKDNHKHETAVVRIPHISGKTPDESTLKSLIASVSRCWL